MSESERLLGILTNLNHITQTFQEDTLCSDEERDSYKEVIANTAFDMYWQTIPNQLHSNSVH